jgi:hypothetical protein
MNDDRFERIRELCVGSSCGTREQIADHKEVPMSAIANVSLSYFRKERLTGR